MVFASTRSGVGRIWLKDLTTGQESLVAGGPGEESHPVISHDGSRIAYSFFSPDDRQMATATVSRTRQGSPELACNQCGWVWDWSPDNHILLFNDWHPVWRIGGLDVKNNKKRSVISSSNRSFLYQARFSPDAKWIAFGQQINFSNSRIFIALFKGMNSGVAPSESQWIPITDNNGWCDKPRWSPDGRLLYFISHRDGYRCLWAQRLSPQTKRPIGEPFSVAHFHSTRLSMMSLGTALLEVDVAQDKLVFNLGELTGNIWLADTK